MQPLRWGPPSADDELPSHRNPPAHASCPRPSLENSCIMTISPKDDSSTVAGSGRRSRVLHRALPGGGGRACELFAVRAGGRGDGQHERSPGEPAAPGRCWWPGSVTLLGAPSLSSRPGVARPAQVQGCRALSSPEHMMTVPPPPPPRRLGRRGRLPGRAVLAGASPCS